MTALLWLVCPFCRTVLNGRDCCPGDACGWEVPEQVTS